MTEFVVASDWTQPRLRQRLGELVNSQAIGLSRALIFYDTFDWRLHGAGWMLEFRRGSESQVWLRRIDDGYMLIQPMEFVSPMIDDWPNGLARATLRDICGVRALLPMVALSGHAEQFAVLNEDAKTVCRLSVERWCVDKARAAQTNLSCRIRIAPLRGWHHEAAAVSEALARTGFLPAGNTLLEAALSCVNRSPGDYSPMFQIELKPIQSTGEAARAILKQLLADLRRNEHGVKRHIDSEFLHDFRVAVRRTRSALSEFRNIFDDQAMAPFLGEFRTLGRVTGNKRDLDVHLNDLDSHTALLDEQGQHEMQKLHPLLVAESEAAGQELTRYLKSKEYRQFCNDWKFFLNHQTADGKLAEIPIKVHSDRRIWRAYKRIISDGSKIQRQSPDEKLHDLRKQGKKLRYLIEFFQSLYPGKEIKGAIRQLKDLQNQLGLFQDQCVQIETLTALKSGDGVAVSALVLDHLIKGIDDERRNVRNEFKSHFKAFADSRNKARYEALFRPGDIEHARHRSVQY